MRKRKIVTVVGARPQFIKAIALSRKLRKVFREVIVHTGQHYDTEMSRDIFFELAIPKPKYNLGIGSAGQGKQVAKMLLEIENVLIKEKPDFVIVYGDTNSTLAGALAAAKLKIPLVHIEAGLRSFNRTMSEETNRVVVDHLSNFLFCPTERAVSNLKGEGIKKGVYLVGDVMRDSLRYYLPRAKRASDILTQLGLRPGGYYLLTIHRAENTADRNSLKKLLSYLDNLDCLTVFPVHPRTRKVIGHSFKPRKGLIVTLPVSYLNMLMLQKNARAVLTDSGGMQKEAYLLEVPCLTLRSETEWLETLKGRCNKLVGFKPLRIINELKKLDSKRRHFTPCVYGKGSAAAKIVKILRAK